MEKCKNCGEDYIKPKEAKQSGYKYRDLVAKETCSIKCYEEYKKKVK